MPGSRGTSLAVAALLVGGPTALLACGGDGADPRERALEALARVPIADAYELRVALREPGGRRRIVRLVVEARDLPRPSGVWKATYEVDVAGRPSYELQSAARQDVVSVSVGSGASSRVPSEVGRSVTFASRLPRRVLDSRFVLAPYDRVTLDPSSWPGRLEPVAGPAAGVDRLEGPALAEAVVRDARSFVESVAGRDRAASGAKADGAEMAVDVGADGRLQLLVARAGIEGGGRVSVQLTARPVGRGGLSSLRARAGAPLRRLPPVMRGAVPPRVRDAFGVGDPQGG